MNKPDQDWTDKQLTEMYGDDIISKLAFLSGCHKRKLCNDPDGDGYIINDDVLDKFAKLIVKECASLSDKSHRHFNVQPKYNHTQNRLIDEGFTWGRESLAKEIKDHFRV